jgi:hypothetical protein
MKPNYESISKHCHVMRNFGDVMDEWVSISGIIDYFAENQDIFSKYNGTNNLTFNIVL